MAFIGGKAGCVDGENTVGQWGVNEKSTVSEYAGSNADGAVGAVEGNTDWDGSYYCFNYLPANFPGDAISFSGSVDGTKGVQGDALVASLTVEADAAGAGVVKSTVTIEANGALTKGAEAVSDSTVPTFHPAKVASVSLGATAVTGFQKGTMVLTAKNGAYVDGGVTKRVPGNISGTFSFSVLDDDWSSTPVIGANHIVKFYVTATLFWQLKWCMVESISDLVCDINDPGKVIGYTVNMKFNGYAAGVQGNIYSPTPTLEWGTANPA